MYVFSLDYYNIVTKYRIAPLMRVTSNDPQPNSTEEALWAFVNEDLEKALAMCPEYSTKYYVSLQAAKALAARAYIAQGKKAEGDTEKLLNIKADQYDLVVNGYESASGAVRRP